MNEKLGKTFTDRVTGFRGVAIGHVTYISGCSQLLLAPVVGAGGEFRESQWFDEQRAHEEDDGPILFDNGATPGFDKGAPKI